jgi:hypothetical protein
MVDVLNYTDKEIDIMTPALAPGVYMLNIPCGNIGNALYVELQILISWALHE